MKSIVVPTFRSARAEVQFGATTDYQLGQRSRDIFHQPATAFQLNCGMWRACGSGDLPEPGKLQTVLPDESRFGVYSQLPWNGAAQSRVPSIRLEGPSGNLGFIQGGD